jgi:uncharacterized alkaline shock family protein YloU
MTDVIQRPAIPVAEQQVMSPTEQQGRKSTRGAIHIKDDVVAKLAAYVASELRDIGGPSSRLARLPGGDFGGGKADLHRRPTVTAHVDGALIHLDMVVSIHWPASVPQATAQLQQHLRDKVPQLTGLQVGEVRIHVADLITDTASVARVH